MIDLALSIFKNELATYLAAKGDEAANVRIDNIGLSETSSGNALIDNIIITLVNVEEESSLKNQAPRKRFGSGTASYLNTPTFLNLYVLISCNYFGDGYILALKRLSLVIQFLQGKTSFSGSSSVTDNTDAADIRFTLELYTLTFEQINHLWGSLGGRQVPFAMYKLRLVGITDQKVVREVRIIEEINTTISTNR